MNQNQFKSEIEIQFKSEIHKFIAGHHLCKNMLNDITWILKTEYEGKYEKINTAYKGSENFHALLIRKTDYWGERWS